jgi:hypothetical protein
VDGHISCAKCKRERPSLDHHPSLLGGLEGKKCKGFPIRGIHKPCGASENQGRGESLDHGGSKAPGYYCEPPPYAVLIGTSPQWRFFFPLLLFVFVF